MPRQPEDLTHHRFGKLVVLKRSPTRPAYWVCQCDCGSVRVVNGGSLKQNKTLSCGCYRAERVKAPRKIKKRKKTKRTKPESYMTGEWI